MGSQGVWKGEKYPVPSGRRPAVRGPIPGERGRKKKRIDQLEIWEKKKKKTPHIPSLGKGMVCGCVEIIRERGGGKEIDEGEKNHFGGGGASLSGERGSVVWGGILFWDSTPFSMGNPYEKVQ